MKVRDLMVKNVITCAKDDPILDTAKKIIDHDIGMLVVLEDNLSQKPVGVISDRDILERVLLKNLNPSKTIVAQIMTKKIISVQPDADVNNAVTIMNENKIKRIVVIDDLQNLVGILSRADLIKQFLTIRQQLVDFAEGL